MPIINAVLWFLMQHPARTSAPLFKLGCVHETVDLLYRTGSRPLPGGPDLLSVRYRLSVRMPKFVGVFPKESAQEREITQLSSSGCGVTALVNVLTAFNLIGKDDISLLDTSMCTLRKRDNDAPLPQYLASRSVAGCTGQDLVSSMAGLLEANAQHISGRVEGMFLDRKKIEGPLGVFIENLLIEGRCVVATLNLQLYGQDAWHHQLVYGVEGSDTNGERTIHMLNPVCCYPESAVDRLVSTPSVLLVRSEDILLRLERPVADDSIYDNEQWRPFKVREQIAAITESQKDDKDGPSHVIIPANYIGGITVFRKVPHTHGAPVS